MAAPTKILELMDRFQNNFDSYKRPAYNETQLRREFLDPFFKALDWDVDNEQGFAEAYKDVIHEDAIKVGRATKAPDYCFRIGGARKFFVEAKKPSINIKEDAASAYQLRRYAWSAKLSLSILTNFEWFQVYDCRFKPARTDKPSHSCIMSLRYTDYLERWQELTDIFSRQAILKGSFDRYVEAKRVKKGTTEVDTAFLQEIERWREVLARNMALRNQNLSQRELNYAVQVTIDRIIFLRICEDRGIESYARLMALQNGQQVYQRLFNLFYQADERYNSGLFHFQTEKGRSSQVDALTPNLVIDDKILKDIFKNLYYPDSPYEFSVLPADILGQVYERFLGKVIRLTAGHRAVVEDKPEVRKAGGVYYTPTYIVDYIVRQTVGKLLEGRSMNRKGEIGPLRVLDPACGSGSFLLDAYQSLLTWHLDQYLKEPDRWLKGRSPRLIQTPGGFKLTIGERKRLLLTHIFGVDIDAQAAEVTKLSLLLKVLEGEDEQSVGAQLALFRERALPDLGSNIKCGNSLIGPDFYHGKQQSFLPDEEAYRINAFDWQAEFPEIMAAGGFDAVIGNPPYGAEYNTSEKRYFLNKFKLQNYQLDSYLIFVEKSFAFLNNKGFFGMIIPNPWLTNLLQRNIRNYICNNLKIHEIVHFRDKVFPKATVDTEIIVVQKDIPRHWEAKSIIVNSILDFKQNNIDSNGINIIHHEQEYWSSLNGNLINIFIDKYIRKLVQIILNNSYELKHLCKINVGIKPYQKGKGVPPQSKETVTKRTYDSNIKIDENYRQIIRGRDIKRYVISPVDIRFIKYGPWLAEPRPSANFDAEFKIFTRQTGDSLIAALDTHKLLCMNNLHVIVPLKTIYSIYFILELLNSNLLNWYYQLINPEIGEALAEVKKTNVEKLPIKIINFRDGVENKIYLSIINNVKSILSFKKQLSYAKTPQEVVTLERQIAVTDSAIDHLVYELYGLTAEEIKLVEEEAGPKK